MPQEQRFSMFRNVCQCIQWHTMTSQDSDFQPPVPVGDPTKRASDLYWACFQIRQSRQAAKAYKSKSSLEGSPFLKGGSVWPIQSKTRHVIRSFDDFESTLGFQKVAIQNRRSTVSTGGIPVIPKCWRCLWNWMSHIPTVHSSSIVSCTSINQH